MSECIFCKIVAKQINANVVHQSEHVLAFRDVNPQAPTHILIIPKKHLERLSAVGESDLHLISEIHKTIQLLAKQEGLTDKGYRVVNNEGEYGGQTVHHIHFHLLGGRPLTWPPG